jgi:hypothetical protein
MRREEYVLVVGKDRDTPTMGEQRKRFTRAALVSGFLGLTMCVALASMAFKNQSSAEMLGIAHGAGDLDSGLAMELIKMAPTASVPQLQGLLDRTLNQYSPRLETDSHVQSLADFQALADTGKLCAKREIIIQKFDELLARLMQSQKLMDDTLDSLKSQFEAAKKAWLDCTAGYILAETKANDAKKGEALAKDKFEKWKNVVTLAIGNLYTIEQEYNKDYDDILAERAMILEIMRLIGVLEELPLEFKRDETATCGPVKETINGIPIGEDGTPFPIPCKKKIQTLKEIVTGAIKGAADVVQNAVNKAQEAINKAAEQAKNAVNNTINAIKNFKFKLWAADPHKTEAIRTRLVQMAEKSAAVSPKFQGQLVELTQTLAESSETREVKIILNKLLEEIQDRANALQASYDKAKKDLKDAQDKNQEYEAELVKLADAADKSEEARAAKSVEKEKLSAAHTAAKEKYENEKAKALADSADISQQIKIIKLIKKKLNDYCSTPGYCSLWYYSPTGKDEITTMPDVSKLTPSKAVAVPAMTFGSDDDFKNIVGVDHFDRVALTMRGTLEVKKAGSYSICTESDDGSHIKIDGVDVASAPGPHPPRKKCGDITLDEGNHDIFVTFFENGGGAMLKGTYSGPDTNGQEKPLPSIGFTGDCSAPAA